MSMHFEGHFVSSMPLDLFLFSLVLSLTLHDLGCLIEVRSCAALVQRQRARLLLRRHVFQRFHQLLAPSLLLPARIEIEVVRNHLENRAQLHDVVSVGAATDNNREMKRLFQEHDQGTQKKEKSKEAERSGKEQNTAKRYSRR